MEALDLKSGVSRWEFLKDAALTAGAIGVVGPLAACGPQPSGPAEGSPKARPTGIPIKIGAMYITSGSLSLYGTFGKQGLDLAVDQINEQVEYLVGRSSLRSPMKAHPITPCAPPAAWCSRKRPIS